MLRELYLLMCMLMKLKQRKNKTYLRKKNNYNTYMISILIVNDTLLKGPATLLYSYLEVSLKLKFIKSLEFRFLGNCPPTPPLSHHFTLSENQVLMLACGGVGF